MKKLALTLSLAAMATMISCSPEEPVGPNGGNSNSDADNAYVTVAIDAPAGRAEDGTTEDGTAEESKFGNVTLIAFDDADSYIDTYTSSTLVAGTTASYSFKVNPAVRGLFAIVNPASEISTAAMTLTPGEAYAAVLDELNNVARTVDAADLSQPDAFTMVNAGVYDEATKVNNILATVAGPLSMEKANPTIVSVTVDRMVSKFTSAKAADFETASESFAKNIIYSGAKLNATNTKSYIYSDIRALTGAYKNDYRTDPNMSNSEANFATELNWMTNKSANTFGSGTEYVLENTATSAHFDYINLTQAVVKVAYDPTAIEADLTAAGQKTWFTMLIEGTGYVIMTFDGVKDYYANTASADTKTKMDSQLAQVLTKAGVAVVDWSAIDYATLNAIDNLGYLAATIDKEENYIVQMYKDGVNYYDIFIQHDALQAPYTVGRWGMVRNNSYALTVSKITNLGLPYVPDPTDPEIKDPQNPDPKDPEQADPVDAYIQATIVVNPWTIWTQSNDLN